MMKKLLILMLVLGMTSTASAALTWSTSALTMNPTDVVTVQIHGSTDLPYPGGPAWVGNDPSPGGVASITSISALANAGGDAEVSDPTATGWPGWWTINALDVTAPFTIAPGAQWDVVITAAAAGTYVIGTDSYGSDGADDLLTITVVPEPMTIALLGLGGLFLMRRRKK
jgi:hypothetical protein